MFHPDTLAALAKERRNAMLAEAAGARLASETRRYHRVPGSPEVRRAGPVAAQLRDVFARLVVRAGGLPSASGPYRPVTAAARERGGKA